MTHNPRPHFILKHVGNMGDMVFFVPPLLETLKRIYPDCHITFVTAWGFKETHWGLQMNTKGLPRLARKAKWGKRNQDGFCIRLMQTNPHIDQLIHWHDTKLSLEGAICNEGGKSYPTWNPAYFDEQARSPKYAGVYSLDFGMKPLDNPMQRLYAKITLPNETYSNYKLYFTPQDLKVAEAVTKNIPRPRIVLLEGIENISTRGWDPSKLPVLEKKIRNTYGVAPLWFGSRYVPEFEGRPLTLRENIATLQFCDVAIGVLSGPLHFAVAAGIPTLTLFGDQPLHRAAPAYFTNEYRSGSQKLHRTLLGPSQPPYHVLKLPSPDSALTPAEHQSQNFRNWLLPGRQSTKSSIAPITVDEVLDVLHDMLS